MSEPFGTLSLEHSSTVDRVAEELRRAVFDGELESGTPLREVALAESLGVSRPTVREALATWSPRGWPPGSPTVGSRSRVPIRTRSATSARPARSSRSPASGAGPRPPRGAAGGPRQPRQLQGGGEEEASYQVLNQRHLDFHLSLVGLAGSPRLEAMATSLYAELRLALAQVDRVRQNAPDQAGSHTVLVRLLESGDIEATAAS